MAKKSFFNSTPFIVGTIAVVAGGAFFAARSLSKKLKERKQENAVNQVDSKDPKRALASTLAQRTYTAFFPSGYPGMWDGTDEAALFRVARELFVNKIPFTYLTEAYRKLYSRQLAQDLADELSSDELSRFYSLYQKGLGAVAKQTFRKIREVRNKKGNKSINLL